MRISYNKLQKLMIDNQMKRQDLMRAAEISSSVATKLNKNETVSLDVLMRICKVFHCDIGDAPYDYQLKAAIRNQMQHASCVLILAGVYSTYSKWINIEIQLAQEMGKKIIAIEPWASERTSLVVKRAANDIVKWNTDSIVRAIRGY
ncbi:MAG TPA: helix-turn-helix domain-containing protein [Lachnospiraceae bacterium]|uniref:helix-turn-helix domain-containing protein n=2 Tax=Bacteria TaxID=2 RepID=UPI002FBA6F4E